MTAHIEVHLKPAEGALLRTLGLIQRRGFSVTEMRLESVEFGQRLHCSVVGDGRCVDLLTRQIGRLHDVERVERAAAEPWPLGVHGMAAMVASQATPSMSAVPAEARR